MNEAPLESPAASAASSDTTNEPSRPDGVASPEATPAAPVVSGPDGSSTSSPASNGAPSGQPEINWKEKHESIERNFNELRRKLQLQGNEKNEYKKQFEAQQATLKQLTEAIASLQHDKTYDPDQFMEEFRAQGPKYLTDLLQKEREKLLADTNSKVESLSSTVTELRTERSIERRRGDAENYPDFKQMEADMAKLYIANRALFDSQYEDQEDKLDALYNAVKLQRSPDALKQAEALGRKKSEEELAREAHASGAGGGKAGAVSAPDPSRMTSEQLREYFAGKGMVSDS